MTVRIENENTVMQPRPSFIDTVLAWLNALYGMPAIAVVFFSAIAFGYVWKVTPFISNRFIPAVVVLGSGVWLCLLATRQPDVPVRVWLVRHFLLGIFVGLIAWIFHNRILKKIETQIPFLGKLLDDGTDTNKSKPQESEEITK